MILNLVADGDKIYASGIDQLINVLQQPSGGTETGKYVVNGWGSASGDFVSGYLPSLSRNATPVSVTLDEADIAHNGCNAISSGQLTANGFQTFTTTTGAVLNARVAGNTTINF